MINPNVIEFFVAGDPVAKGSAKAFFNRKTGRAMVVQTNAEKQKPWASMISYIAQQRGLQPYYSGIVITLAFKLRRPRFHFKGDGSLSSRAELYHSKRPDLDKLVRTVLDALTGLAWLDDSQVCQIEATKQYAAVPGVAITIREV